MSTSSEKFCSPEDEEKENSERTTKKKEDLQKDEKRTLQCNLATKIYPMDLRDWPICHLLKPEFISQIHMVMIYGENVHWGNRAIIVTKDKNVYSLDYNEDDCSNTSNIHTPKKIEELCGKNIKTFAHSLYCVLALTEEGEVYFGEFRVNIDGASSSTFTEFADLHDKRIVDITCGNNHFLILTSNGRVYAWGENNYGQIGNGNIDTFNSVLKEVNHELENQNVVHIACGSTFNIVITDENKLYGWGNNEDSQISPVKSQKYYVYPHEITTISGKIVKVVCGYKHTLALTNKGEIYAWGGNSHGQVGIDNNIKQIFDPIMVNKPKMGMVLDIAAIGNFSVAVVSDRTIYVWGDCSGRCISTPFPMKFSRIHYVFASNGWKIMHKPLTVSMNNYEYVEEGLNILESLQAAFDDPTTSDFIIQVEGQPIHVHKCILKIRCQYFKNMFQHDWVENDQNSSAVHTMSDKFSYIIYKAFLKYLYTDTVDLSSENVLELMELADMYCETNLKRDCIQIIKQVITVSDIAFFYNKAIEYNAKELEEFCFQFALRHMKTVVLSDGFMKFGLSTMTDFIRRGAEEDVFTT